MLNLKIVLKLVYAIKYSVRYAKHLKRYNIYYRKPKRLIVLRILII